jgi:hypothetical protein
MQPAFGGAIRTFIGVQMALLHGLHRRFCGGLRAAGFVWGETPSGAKKGLGGDKNFINKYKTNNYKCYWTTY